MCDIVMIIVGDDVLGVPHKTLITNYIWLYIFIP